MTRTKTMLFADTYLQKHWDYLTKYTTKDGEEIETKIDMYRLPDGGALHILTRKYKGTYRVEISTLSPRKAKAARAPAKSEPGGLPRTRRRTSKKG